MEMARGGSRNNAYLYTEEGIWDKEEWNRGRPRREVRKQTVVVIGTGDLGRALVVCLVRAGYKAVVASRNPKRNKARIRSVGGTITTLEEAVHLSHIILNAIPYEGFVNLPPNLLRRKILVDVSNRPLDYSRSEESLAVKLQNFLPETSVVKAFNTLSAYALQRGLQQGSKEVPICSNDDEAKATVISLARDLGFSPIDYGSLSNAKAIEDMPLSFFKGWTVPVLFEVVIFFIAFIIVLFRSQLCPNFENDVWDWTLFASIPLSNVEMCCALTAITLLAACYFPGVLAAYIQLHRQTKYSEFPYWLDVWLKGRKEFGLLALFTISIHVMMMFILHAGIAQPVMDWHENLFFMCGVLTFALMSILGITSLPSVTANLTWREFSFVQRYLGWTSLFLATCHIVFLSWGDLFKNQFECIFIPDTKQIFIMFPLLTLLLKIPLLLPCVDSKLQKIRRGYEGRMAIN